MDAQTPASGHGQQPLAISCIGNRNFESLGALLPRSARTARQAQAERTQSSQRRGFDRDAETRFEWQGRSANRQSRRHAGGRGTLEPGGDFAPPFRLDGQVAFGGSGDAARNRRAPQVAQEARHKNSKSQTDRHSRRRNAGRFLSPFRFALRMSRRTEIGSHEHSTSGAPHGKKCVELSRIG